MSEASNPPNRYSQMLTSERSRSLIGTSPFEFFTSTVRGGIQSIAWHPTQPLLAATYSGSIGIWHSESKSLLHVLQGHTYVASDVTYRPDGLELASSSWDGTVRIWDAHTGRVRLVL